MVRMLKARPMKMWIRSYCSEKARLPDGKRACDCICN